MTDDLLHDVIDEEASALGFRPGEWPPSFEYDGVIVYLLRLHRSDFTGDVMWADYGYDGGRLRVFND
jgi:hypothetical protein